MDIILGLPLCRGYDVIAVFVDRPTKMAHFIPTRSNITAEEFALLFFRHIFPLHGMPLSIVSDRDSKFTSQFWRELMLPVGSKVKLSTAYHPQTDGQTERTNRTFEDMLRCYATVYQEDWVRPLPMLEFCYNDTVHSSPGYTPFFLTTGRHPHTPSTKMLPSTSSR